MNVAKLVDEQTQSCLAEIRLNGYRIDAGGPLGGSGPLLSFYLVSGDIQQVRQYWRQMMPLRLEKEKMSLWRNL